MRPIRTLIILITTTTGITHMASFRSIMILMTFIISIMTDILVAVILVVILMVVTTAVFMAEEGGLDCRAEVKRRHILGRSDGNPP